FFMAYWLPLLGFLTLARTGGNQPGKGTFAAAALLGVLSGLTMANGLLALPLMVVQGLVMRLSPRRVATLAGLAAALTGGYLIGYESPDWRLSWLETVQLHPVETLMYLLAYLGGPLYH